MCKNILYGDGAQTHPITARTVHSAGDVDDRGLLHARSDVPQWGSVIRLHLHVRASQNAVYEDEGESRRCRRCRTHSL
jgi:hypothetical protein